MNKGLTDRILNLPRVAKRVIALTVDAVLCCSTVAVAFVLRSDDWVFPTGTQWLSYAGAVLFALPLFISFGLYRAIFRYVGWNALMAVVRACAVYGMLYSGVFTAIGVSGVPRMIGIIQPILLFVAMGASRAVARYWLGGGYRALQRFGRRRRVLIYGAGSAGRQLAAALASNDEMQVVGFVDDDTTLHRSVLNGKMIHPSEGIAKLIEKLDITDLLLAIPSASRKRRNEILELVRGTLANIRTLPGVTDLAQGRVTVNDLRELDIEDLLGRDAVLPNKLLLSKNITGKIVLVSGAGGSIGSELCRQILSIGPKALILVEMNEFNLYSIHQELINREKQFGFNPVEIVPILCSISDETRINSILSNRRPSIIYHAAAYKHVPLVEDNESAGVRNNVFGTLALARLAQKNEVADFVLISTDKAVRPTNIMGTTKRLAEMVLQALAAEQPGTRFSMVRFGNVLGSSGSVVPLFRRQISVGGPVTITDREITRYFMTIPEAAQLVIQAGAMANGGDVFVLDMGSPVKIIDLAKEMIELSGLSVKNEANPDGDIEIVEIGLRPGEKLYEELLIGNQPTKTTHSRIMKAHEHFMPWTLLQPRLHDLEKAAEQARADEIRDILKDLVPEYGPENRTRIDAA